MLTELANRSQFSTLLIRFGTFQAGFSGSGSASVLRSSAIGFTIQYNTIQYNTINSANNGTCFGLVLYCILVLVRLRLDLLVGDLADIYSLSKESVSKLFTTWINMLYHVFKDILIAWPTMQQVRRHLPNSFVSLNKSNYRLYLEH